MLEINSGCQRKRETTSPTEVSGVADFALDQEGMPQRVNTQEAHLAFILTQVEIESFLYWLGSNLTVLSDWLV